MSGGAQLWPRNAKYWYQFAMFTQSTLLSTKYGSIVWQTSVPAKSSNFNHPYSVVQQFTTGPCGASIAISCSCADHEGDLKKKR